MVQGLSGKRAVLLAGTSCGTPSRFRRLVRAVGTPVSIGEPGSSAPTRWAVETEAVGQLWALPGE